MSFGDQKHDSPTSDTWVLMSASELRNAESWVRLMETLAPNAPLVVVPCNNAKLQLAAGRIQRQLVRSGRKVAILSI